MSEFSRHMKEVALATLGKPDETKKQEWRYGTHGSLAVDIDSGTWYDHEAEEGGGVLDLIMRECGRATPKAAISWLKEQGYITEEQPAKPKGRARIAETYDYADENGELRYQVCRMEPKSFRQRVPDGSGWSWSVKGIEQLPYRLPELLANPKLPVFIVEGEKDVDNLADAGVLATCNSGGAGKWPDELTQWFKGRRVALLPDNDEAGRKHAEMVASRLYGIADSVRVVIIEGLPEKGDVSDWLASGGDRDQLYQIAKNADLWEPDFEEDPELSDEQLFGIPEAASTSPSEPAEAPPEPAGKPFICLGYDSGSYFYLPKSSEQVVEVKAASHTSPATLMQLAEFEWWEMAYPKEKGGVDWNVAASDLMRRCEKRGVYSLKNVRGRGAWYDKGASILHLGDRLVVDGQHKKIGEHHSQFIYTRQPPMESIIEAVEATNEHAQEVFDICQAPNWENKVHGWLFAGFVALAPICGAMPWRPHVWLVGSRGSGKSWLQENITHPLLGGSALMVQGGTTEAGIRQAIKSDARPIVFDEAESEDMNAQKRIKSVIELARQASSDGSAEIVKGTVSGSGMAFRIRSMFMLGSINVSLSQAADESRFSVLTLGKPSKTPEAVAKFKELERKVGATLTEERCAAIRARTYKLIPVIRQNAKTMAQAVAEQLGSQRIGDQVGTLLAGAISLSREDAITLDEARSWASQIDLTEAQEAEEVSDEMSCIQTILQTQVRFDFSKGSMQRTLGEVLQGAAGKKQLESDIFRDECNDILSRFGMRIYADSLAVSNTHAELKKVLRDTPWGAGWRRVLVRLEGAKPAHAPLTFGGTQTRAVLIPLEQVV